MDEVFTSVCIRATLDAFWSRSSGTVIKHLTEVRFICRYAERLGIVKPFPRLGPFPRGHHLGMLQAMIRGPVVTFPPFFCWAKNNWREETFDRSQKSGRTTDR